MIKLDYKTVAAGAGAGAGGVWVWMSAKQTKLNRQKTMERQKATDVQADRHWQNDDDQLCVSALIVIEQQATLHNNWCATCLLLENGVAVQEITVSNMRNKGSSGKKSKLLKRYG